MPVAPLQQGLQGGCRAPARSPAAVALSREPQTSRLLEALGRPVVSPPQTGGRNHGELEAGGADAGCGLQPLLSSS